MDSPAAADVDYKTVDFGRIDRLAQQGYMSADSRDLAAAALRESHAALERDEALQQAADRSVELAKANVRNAAEALRLARIIESYTSLAAPIDGVILVRQAEIGEVVSPGTPIFTLADIEHVWLRAYVNETDVGRIRLGEPAVLTTDNYPGKRYRGRVSFIAEQAEFTPKSVETHAERVTLVYRISVRPSSRVWGSPSSGRSSSRCSRSARHSWASPCCDSANRSTDTEPRMADDPPLKRSRRRKAPSPSPGM